MLLILSVFATLFAFVDFSEPEISFIEFRDHTHGRMAVFQITNESDSTFCYSGYGSSFPLYYYRVSTPSGWNPQRLGWCGTGANLHEIAPHSMTEFEVQPHPECPEAPFSVGLHFKKGTALEVQTSYSSPSYIAVFIEWFRQRMPLKKNSPEPTWSTVAQSQRTVTVTSTNRDN